MPTGAAITHNRPKTNTKPGDDQKKPSGINIQLDGKSLLISPTSENKSKNESDTPP